MERLRAIGGIGPWTAHYIAMRALGWADAFPPGDVAVLNALALPRGVRAEREAETRSQAWRPWRAYAVLALWNTLPPPGRAKPPPQVSDAPAASTAAFTPLPETRP